MSHRHFALRPAEGEYHIQTNHFLTPELQGLNLFLNRSVDEDSEARFQRIRQRLQEASGQLDANEAISILGDQIDPLVNEFRGVGNTVGVHTTLTSVVIDPKRGRALVATGPAPACHSDYLELPLIGTFNRDDFASLAQPVIHCDGFGQTHPQKLAAEQVFIQAKIAYEVANDGALAYQLLKEAAKQDSSNPAYCFQLGIFALKNERFDEAIEAFDAVFRAAYLTAQLRRLAYYYRARTFAHLGQNKEAQADLVAVLDDAHTDHKLRAAALRVARRVKVFGRLALRKRSLAIMMQQSDMLNY